MYGLAVRQSDENIWLGHASEPNPSKDGLERSYIAEYEELGTVAFEREAYKQFVEMRDGLG